MSFGHTVVEISNTSCLVGNLQEVVFNNLSIVWPIKILLITFCQEGPQMLCAKFRANR